MPKRASTSSPTPSTRRSQALWPFKPLFRIVAPTHTLWTPTATPPRSTSPLSRAPLDEHCQSIEHGTTNHAPLARRPLRTPKRKHPCQRQRTRMDTHSSGERMPVDIAPRASLTRSWKHAHPSIPQLCMPAVVTRATALSVGPLPTRREPEDNVDGRPHRGARGGSTSAPMKMVSPACSVGPLAARRGRT